MAKQPQSCAFRTSIGGQALIEGILMRGPEKQAIVVRDQGGNLVEKVEEYRSTEEAMRKALMTAQRMADDLVKEAEQKRDQILQEAAAEAQKKVDSIRQEAEAEQFRLAAAQKETAGYVAKVKAQAQAYLDQLDQLVPTVPDQQEEKVEEAVSDIDDSVQRLVAQAMAEAAAENEKVRQAEEGQSAEDLSDTAEFPAQKVQPEENEDLEKTTRIDFGELQFGRDYEIK